MRISSINFVTAKPKKTFAKNNAIKSTTPSFNQTQNIIFKANLNIQDASLTQEIKDAKKDAQEIYLRTQEVKQNAHKIKDEVLENIAQLQKLAQGKSRYSIKANNVRYTYSIKDMHDDEYVKFWKECSYKEVTDGVVTREVSYNLNDNVIVIYEFDPETNKANNYFFTHGNLQTAQIDFPATAEVFGNFEKFRYDMFDGSLKSYQKIGDHSEKIAKFAQWDKNEELSVYASDAYRYGLFGDFQGRFLCFNDGKFERIATSWDIN